MRLSIQIATIALSSCVLGCSWVFGGSEEAEYTELTFGKESKQTTAEVAKLSRAQELYESGLFAASQTAFEEFIEDYPRSGYRELAESKIADTLFISQNYGQSSSSFQTLYETYSFSASRPYYALMAGRSFYLMSAGPGRDIAPVKKSLELYGLAERSVLGSPYASMLHKWRRESLEHVVEHEELIASFYEKQGMEQAEVERREKVSSLSEELSDLFPSGAARAGLRDSPATVSFLECRDGSVPMAVAFLTEGTGLDALGDSGGSPSAFLFSPPLSESVGAVELEQWMNAGNCRGAFTLRTATSGDSSDQRLALSYRPEGGTDPSIETLLLENPKRLFVFFR